MKNYEDMLKRITQIEVFLENCEWKQFTTDDALKCVNHIKKGGGWL